MKLLLQAAVLSLFFLRAVLVSPELHHPMFLPPLRREGPVPCPQHACSQGMNSSGAQHVRSSLKERGFAFAHSFRGHSPPGQQVQSWLCCGRSLPHGLIVSQLELRVEIRARSRTGVKPSMRASGGPYQPARVYVSKILFVTSEKKFHQLGTKCLKMSPWG